MKLEISVPEVISIFKKINEHCSVFGIAALLYLGYCYFFRQP